MIKHLKHQCTCNDCGKTFFLDDVDWCIHHQTLGVGTKECPPQCHSCICHGVTVEQIQARFDKYCISWDDDESC